MEHKKMTDEQFSALQAEIASLVKTTKEVPEENEGNGMTDEQFFMFLETLARLIESTATTPQHAAQIIRDLIKQHYKPAQ